MDTLENASNPCEYKFYTHDVGDLEGKLLTLIDASISDKEQKRAIKDIVRQIVWDWVLPKNVTLERVAFVPRA